MSHFSVMVITDDTDKVEELMAPYCEQFEEDDKIPEWFEFEVEVENHNIKKEAKRLTKDAVDNNKDWARKYKNLAHKEDWEGILDRHYGGIKHNGDWGHWNNSSAKWDWWRIGGRWDGRMLGLEEIDDGDGGFNFDDKYETLERNSCLLKDIKEDYVPFAVVTPDGKWHERGDMGWWGIVSNEKDETAWGKEAKSVFKKYLECKAVLLDCHI